jgi:hypothetical protein
MSGSQAPDDLREVAGSEPREEQQTDQDHESG